MGQFDMQVRIDRGVNIDRALSALRDFIQNYANDEMHQGRRHGVMYSWDNYTYSLYVCQTETCYIVRSNSLNNQGEARADHE